MVNRYLGTSRGASRRQEASLFRRSHNQLKVTGLPDVCDIDQPVTALLLQAVLEGSQICGAI